MLFPRNVILVFYLENYILFTADVPNALVELKKYVRGLARVRSVDAKRAHEICSICDEHDARSDQEPGNKYKYEFHVFLLSESFSEISHPGNFLISICHGFW